MRCAVVEDGIVTNVIVAEGPDEENGWVEIPEGMPVDIGWTYDDDEIGFIDPNPIPDDGLVFDAEGKLVEAESKETP